MPASIVTQNKKDLVRVLAEGLVRNVSNILHQRLTRTAGIYCSYVVAMGTAK